MIPHAMALVGVAVAWGAEREGVTCAEPWLARPGLALTSP